MVQNDQVRAIGLDNWLVRVAMVPTDTLVTAPVGKFGRKWRCVRVRAQFLSTEVPVELLWSEH